MPSLCFGHTVAIRDRRDGMDRVDVAVEIAQRVRVGACALAQHVVAKSQCRMFPVGRTRLAHRFVDGLAEHELAAQQLHGTQRRGNDRAGTQPCHQSRLGRRVPSGVRRMREEFLRQGDGRGRQTRQGRVGAAVEVGAAQLIGGQRDRRLGVGHPQQRLGQPHQRQALGARNRVFAQQTFHGPERRRLVAHGAHPRGGGRRGRRPVECALQRGEAMGNDVGFRSVRGGQAHGGSPIVNRLMSNFLSTSYSPINRSATG